MLKTLFVLFNFASLIVVTALLPADVKVDTSIEEEMTADSTYLVTVTIQKAKIFGFAKFQHDLPEGFIAKPVETADASFTYADDKVKFIWMSLPEVDEITISYEITPTADAPAQGIVEGKFSYIEDNERKSYDLPNIPIKVLGKDEIVEAVPASANISRSVEDKGDNTYVVTLSIEKAGISGFAKIEEYLPEGAVATAIESKLAVFSQVDEKTKFLWLSVPEEEQLTVSYEVKGEGDILDELNAMEGNFAYLEEDETKSVPVIGGQPLAANTPNTEETTDDPGQTGTTEESGQSGTNEQGTQSTTQETKDDQAVADAQQSQQTTGAGTDESSQTGSQNNTGDNATASNQGTTQAGTQQASTGTGQTGAVTSIPDPETGVRYRVQIVAGHKLVDKAFIQKTYKFTGDYGTENHQGWIKYTTGSYQEYRQARDQRENLIAAKHNFPGPFVTAYNSGERITVQEALMITNQKWVQ